MKFNLKTLFKVTVISISLLVTFLIIFFISKILSQDFVDIEIEGYDFDRPVPKSAPKLLPINSNIFKKTIDSSNKNFYYVQIWSMARTCENAGFLSEKQFDDLVTLDKELDELKILLISYDINSKKIKKKIRLYLYDHGINFDTYIIDANIDYLDLENKRNALDFLQSITKSKDENISNYYLSMLFDNKGNLIKTYDSLDFNRIKKDVSSN